MVMYLRLVPLAATLALVAAPSNVGAASTACKVATPRITSAHISGPIITVKWTIEGTSSAACGRVLILVSARSLSNVVPAITAGTVPLRETSGTTKLRPIRFPARFSPPYEAEVSLFSRANSPIARARVR
jgi:hypothetical protein